MICQRKRLMNYFLPQWYPKKIPLTRRRVREGGGKMDNESKKPCAPVEEEGRDTTTVFREEDPLCAALDDFCYALNFWYGSMNNPWQREDRAYRKKLAKDVQDKLRRVIEAGSVSES